MVRNNRKQTEPQVLDRREARGMVDGWQEYLCLTSNPEGGFKLFVGGYPLRSRKMREDENYETLLFTENDDEAVGRWLEMTGWASQRSVASVKAELTKITSARSSLQFPTNWRNWPTDIEVLFQYTETNAVAADDYLAFAANDLTQAAERLFSVEKDHWYFPGYRLHSVGVVAAISVWVDWPLSRKSGSPRIQERDDHVEMPLALRMAPTTRCCTCGSARTDRWATAASSGYLQEGELSPTPLKPMTSSHHSSAGCACSF